MKKRIFLIIAGALVLGGALYALSTYTATFINESALAYSRVFSLDLNSVAGRDQGVNSLSATVTASTASLSASSFTDGTKSTGSFTVSSVAAISTTTASDTITVPATSQLLQVAASDTLTVVSTNGLTGAYITFNGINLINGRDWFSTSLASTTARSIAGLLNHAPGVVSTNTLSVVYTTATLAGIGGNRFTLSASTPALSVASAHFTGGRESVLINAYITINGKKLRNGYDWTDASHLSTTTARSIAAVLNHITGIVSTNTASVVYTTATTAGSIGNTYTLTASTPALVVASPTFLGGYDNVAVSINDVALTQGVDWHKVATTTGTAINIAAAINANSSLSGIVIATVPTSSSVIIVTSTVAGLTNYNLHSSSAAIVASGTKMTGGTAIAVNTTNSAINLPTSGFTTGLALLYTKSAGTSPQNLVAGTTYYAIYVDANDIKLATSQSNAVAGTNITISTTSTAGGGSFTLTPVAYAGTASWKWQGSNDNSNWVDLSVSSITFSSPFAARTDAWDFTPYDYRYLRLNFTAPTTGGVTIQSTVNGKNSL